MKTKKFLMLWGVTLALLALLIFGCEKSPDEPDKPQAVVSTLTTTAVSAIAQTTAFSGGNITADGGAAVTARGVCWSTSTNPTTASSKTTDGAGTGAFTSSIAGLTANTTYYVRAFATNSVGTAYGSEISFTTSQNIVAPTVTTTAVLSITETTATSGGNVTNDGGATVTARGVCWSTSINPTIASSKTTDGAGTGAFASSLTGLTANTTYYVKAYATNSAGTGYGNEISFTTFLVSTTVTDIDGNVYHTVSIGTQVWMAENLKTTKYRNGNLIGTTTPSTLDIRSESTPKYQWAYNGNESNVAIYGRLYTWYAVTDSRNVCPTGWHLPSDVEWTPLTTYLGGESVAGGKLKETGTTHWNSPNTGATNETGFTALPGGYRDFDGSFYSIGHCGYCWSSTEYDTNYARNQVMYYNSSDIFRGNYNKNNGFSVRCLKD